MGCGCSSKSYSLHKETATLMNHKSGDATANAMLLLDLKTKIICEYNKMLHMIEHGYKPDYEFLLLEIMFVNLMEDCKIKPEEATFYIEYFNTNNYKPKSKNSWLTY